MSATQRYLDRALGPGPLCPTPFKRNYPTLEAGRAVAAETDPHDLTLDAYKCRCGGIHVGHHPSHHRKDPAA